MGMKCQLVVPAGCWRFVGDVFASRSRHKAPIPFHSAGGGPLDLCGVEAAILGLLVGAGLGAHEGQYWGPKCCLERLFYSPFLDAGVRVSMVGNRARDLKWPPAASALEDQPAP